MEQGTTKPTKAIPGYEDRYVIDIDGVVTSIPRQVPSGIPSGFRQTKKKVIRPFVDKQNRTLVKLWKNGKATSFDVSRLIKLTFGI